MGKVEGQPFIPEIEPKKKSEESNSGKMSVGPSGEEVKVSFQAGPSPAAEVGAGKFPQAPAHAGRPMRPLPKLPVGTNRLDEDMLKGSFLPTLERLGDRAALEYRIARTRPGNEKTLETLKFNLDLIRSLREAKLGEHGLSPFRKACELARTLVYDIEEQTKLGGKKDEIKIQKRDWISGMIGFRGLSGRSENAKELALKLLLDLLGSPEGQAEGKQVLSLLEQAEGKQVLSLLGQNQWFKTVMEHHPEVRVKFEQAQQKKLGPAELAASEVTKFQEMITSMVGMRRDLIIGRQRAGSFEAKLAPEDIGKSRVSHESVLQFLGKARAVTALVQDDDALLSKIGGSLKDLQKSSWFKAVSENFTDVASQLSVLEGQVEKLQFIGPRLEEVKDRNGLKKLWEEVGGLSDDYKATKTKLCEAINKKMVEWLSSSKISNLLKNIEEFKDIGSLDKVQEQLTTLTKDLSEFGPDVQRLLNEYQETVSAKGNALIEGLVKSLTQELKTITSSRKPPEQVAETEVNPAFQPFASKLPGAKTPAWMMRKPLKEGSLQGSLVERLLERGPLETLKSNVSQLLKEGAHVVNLDASVALLRMAMDLEFSALFDIEKQRTNMLIASEGGASVSDAFKAHLKGITVHSLIAAKDQIIQNQEKENLLMSAWRETVAARASEILEPSEIGVWLKEFPQSGRKELYEVLKGELIAKPDALVVLVKELPQAERKELYTLLGANNLPSKLKPRLEKVSFTFLLGIGSELSKLTMMEFPGSLMNGWKKEWEKEVTKRSKELGVLGYPELLNAKKEIDKIKDNGLKNNLRNELRRVCLDKLVKREQAFQTLLEGLSESERKELYALLDAKELEALSYPEFLRVKEGIEKFENEEHKNLLLEIYLSKFVSQQRAFQTLLEGLSESERKELYASLNANNLLSDDVKKAFRTENVRRSLLLAIDEEFKNKAIQQDPKNKDLIEQTAKYALYALSSYAPLGEIIDVLQSLKEKSSSPLLGNINTFIAKWIELHKGDTNFEAVQNRVLTLGNLPLPSEMPSSLPLQQENIPPIPEQPDMLKKIPSLAGDGRKKAIETMASEITSVMGSLFLKWNPTLLVTTKASAETGFEISNFFNALNSVIKENIRGTEGTKPDIKASRFWLDVGEKCLEKGDIFSALAIKLALQNPDISKDTKDKKLTDAVESFGKFKSPGLKGILDIFSPFSSFKDLRVYIRAHALEGVIPILSMYFSDITFIKDGNQENGGLSPRVYLTGSVVEELCKHQERIKKRELPEPKTELYDWVTQRKREIEK